MEVSRGGVPVAGTTVVVVGFGEGLLEEVGVGFVEVVGGHPIESDEDSVGHDGGHPDESDEDSVGHDGGHPDESDEDSVGHDGGHPDESDEDSVGHDGGHSVAPSAGKGTVGHDGGHPVASACDDSVGPYGSVTGGSAITGASCPVSTVSQIAAPKASTTAMPRKRLRSGARIVVEPPSPLRSVAVVPLPPPLLQSAASYGASTLCPRLY
jgi:hypothetical protein